jgi:hypothetical protein
MRCARRNAPAAFDLLAARAAFTCANASIDGVFDHLSVSDLLTRSSALQDSRG